MSKKDNVSDAFLSVFQTSGLNFEKKGSYEVDKNLVGMSKVAGMSLYRSTAEEIQSQISRLIEQDTKNLRNAENTKVGNIIIKPTGYAKPHSEEISDATGIAELNVNGKTVEIPFMVHDSELEMFDVIQVDNERVPYSRENLQNIITAIVRKQNAEAQGELQGDAASYNPYVSLKDKANATTTSGFLGNALHIQDRYRFPQVDSGATYHVAEQTMDDCLEKLANMVPFDWKKMENIMLEKTAREQISEFDDAFSMAKTAENTNLLSAIKRFDEFKWVDANSLPNGTSIVFPELIGGNEITMTEGVVLKDFAEESSPRSYNTLVVTKDGRFRDVASHSFICRRSDNKVTIKPSLARELKADDYILLFYKDKITTPIKVSYTAEIQKSMGSVCSESRPKDGIMPSIRRLSVIPDLGSSSSFMEKSIFDKVNRPVKASSMSPDPISKINSIYLLDGVSNLTKVSKLELERLCEQHLGTAKDANNYSYSVGSVDFAMNPEAKVIKLTGFIDGFFKSKKELEFAVSNGSALKDNEMLFIKTAMSGEQIQVVCKDKERDRWDITLSFVDKSKRMFAQRIKKFQNIPEYQVKGILFACKYEQGRVLEFIHKARRDGQITAPLPRDFNAEKITGAASKSATLSSFNKMRKKVFDDGMVSNIASTAIGAALTDTPIAKNSVVRDLVQKRANESRILSATMEKLAIEQKSELYKRAAKLLAVSYHLMEKTASMIACDSSYPQILACCDKICDSKKYIEKIATELIYDKTLRIVNDNYDVHPAYLANAVNHIDVMYKLAAEYMEKCAAQEGEQDDNLSEAEKLKIAEQQEAKKANEKEETPGGKQTPTKLVWRKNRHKMNP